MLVLIIMFKFILGLGWLTALWTSVLNVTKQMAQAILVPAP